MKMFGFYRKDDVKQETVTKVKASSRLEAAKIFSARKCLALKQFLSIFSVTK